ncbi:MAG: hypothetical protein AAGB32_05700 [Pseudomonadota bacterium]
MSNTEVKPITPHGNVFAALNLIDWSGSREEAVLKQNREGAKLLEEIVFENGGNADAAYYLGVIKLNDLDGTGQDLDQAFEYFLGAHEMKHPHGIKGMIAIHKTASERAVECLSQGAFAQARKYHLKLQDFIGQAIYESTGCRIHEAQPAGHVIEFALPKTVVSP